MPRFVRVLAAVSAERAARARRFSPAPARAVETLSQGPLVLSGFLSEILGLGSAARRTGEALRAGGLPVVEDDLSVLRSLPIYFRKAPPAVAAGGVRVFSCNSPELRRVLSDYPAQYYADAYRIGCWAWELERFPPDWAAPLPALNEIWAPSAFVVDALRASFPDAPPVRVAPYPTPDLDDVAPDRAAFGLPQDAFVVLLMFDLRSTRARKNPDAALAAFLRAFPDPGSGALLYCKVVVGEDQEADLAALRAALAGRPHVVVSTQGLSDRQAWTLIRSADVVLSLHRSEGYGLVLAEAMKMRRCVVATNWSGNVDFMDEACACPVPFELAPVRDPQGQYRQEDARWAEADVAAAARALLALHGDPALRARMGEAARRRIIDHEAGFHRMIADAPWRSLVALPGPAGAAGDCDGASRSLGSAALK